MAYIDTGIQRYRVKDMYVYRNTEIQKLRTGWNTAKIIEYDGQDRPLIL